MLVERSRHENRCPLQGVGRRVEDRVSMHLEDLVEEWYKRSPTGLVTTHKDKVRLELVHKPNVFIDILKHIKSHQLQSPHHKVLLMCTNTDS